EVSNDTTPVPPQLRRVQSRTRGLKSAGYSVIAYQGITLNRVGYCVEVEL
ncbi:unnamed protein product, partial [Nesidiocoris tenuis]